MPQPLPNTAAVARVGDPGGNLVLGILAGLAAAIVGALIWMGITVSTGLHVGYVALGVGALVGVAVRYAGHGTGPLYGIIGAVLTLLGCVAGESLAIIQLSTTPEHGFLDVLSHVDLGDLVTHIMSSASPITYFIYAIGIYEGYKFSIRR